MIAVGAQGAKVCHMFPGQGSQKKGMGEGLFDGFGDLVASADKILGYSIAELCLRDPDQRLSHTQYTQPALYTVNALSYFQRVNETGVKPDFVAGHSLGEYNALLAAEVFDFATGLKLVQRRGALMAQAEGGGMAAVIGIEGERVRSILEREGLNQIDLANINAPAQIVISGPRSEIERARSVFESSGASMYIPLNVSGAFHSRYMAGIQNQFGSFLSGFTYAAPRIPVISNVEARPYEPDQVTRLLSDQLTHPVRWVETVQYLRRCGAAEFKEIGPGKVLAGLVKRIGANT